MMKTNQKEDRCFLNQTMIQFFEWNLPNDGDFWKNIRKEKIDQVLTNKGITIVWLPPAFKGHSGINSVGYDLYDLFDLGEFHQKKTTRTKYGTKDEYLDAIQALQYHGIRVIADIVLNHKAGADRYTEVNAIVCDENNRTKKKGEERQILAWTEFDFPGRGETYSSFKWTVNCFNSINYDANSKQKEIFLVSHKKWNEGVDNEKGNFDYLMFANIDFHMDYVREHLLKWGKWLLEQTRLNGFRLDAIKHIPRQFISEWITTILSHNSSCSSSSLPAEPLFIIGEYFSYSISTLLQYLRDISYQIKLFDFPLRNQFYLLSLTPEEFDFRNVFSRTLSSLSPSHTITFIDNHDTQPREIKDGLGSFVRPWFKPLAYSFILTRQEGIPCICYGDYYGIPSLHIPSIRDTLDFLLMLRKEYAYGKQRDYFISKDVMGWTREGIILSNSTRDDEDQTMTEGNRNEEKDVDVRGGLAVLISKGPEIKRLRMKVGEVHAGETWVELSPSSSSTSSSSEKRQEILIDSSGHGEFSVEPCLHAIWVPKS